MEIGLFLAILGATIAVGLAGIGSSIGVGIAGEIASGVISEDPDKFGKCLLLQAIPGTQGIYGFLAAFWVMLKINMLGGVVPISPITGWQIFMACWPVGINCLISGVYQGRVSVAAIAMVAKKPDEAGKGMIFAAMVETYAILGLLATILLLNGVPLK
jgi:V/A-type H+-transporting ATPase subunit K